MAIQYKRLSGIVKTLKSTGMFDNGDISTLEYDLSEMGDPFISLGQVSFDYQGKALSTIEILYFSSLTQTQATKSRTLSVKPSSQALAHLNGLFRDTFIDPILNIIFPEFAGQDWKE